MQIYQGGNLLEPTCTALLMFLVVYLPIKLIESVTYFHLSAHRDIHYHPSHPLKTPQCYIHPQMVYCQKWVVVIESPTTTEGGLEGID